MLQILRLFIHLPQTAFVSFRCSPMKLNELSMNIVSNGTAICGVHHTPLNQTIYTNKKTVYVVTVRCSLYQKHPLAIISLRLPAI